MAQRPSTKRPCKDAVLKAKRSHPARLSSSARSSWTARSRKSKALRKALSRAQLAELALGWFEACAAWRGPRRGPASSGPLLEAAIVGLAPCSSPPGSSSRRDRPRSRRCWSERVERGAETVPELVTSPHSPGSRSPAGPWRPLGDSQRGARKRIGGCKACRGCCACGRQRVPVDTSPTVVKSSVGRVVDRQCACDSGGQAQQLAAPVMLSDSVLQETAPKASTPKNTLVQFTLLRSSWSHPRCPAR